MEHHTVKNTITQNPEDGTRQISPPGRRAYRSPRLYRLGLLETASGDRFSGEPEGSDPYYAPS